MFDSELMRLNFLLVDGLDQQPRSIFGSTEEHDLFFDASKLAWNETAEYISFRFVYC